MKANRHTLCIATRGVALVLLLFLSSCDGNRIEEQLLAVEGVSDVAFFLNYEGRVEADVLLRNGGSMSFHNLREESFVGTDQIYVSQVGNLFIRCDYPGQVGSTGSGHNIITIVLEMAQGEIDIGSTSSISELVENYESIFQQISLLPGPDKPGRRIKFLHRQPSNWDCYKILQE